jgi:branched-chain amino acid transport system substrate-binding protein
MAVNTIGVLLPRSKDYPSLGFDLLHGVRSQLSQSGIIPRFVSENIGFGENPALIYARAEKMIIENDVDIIIGYIDATNAAPLGQLALATQRPFLLVDAGMRLPLQTPGPYVYHITLQGAHACRIAGEMAGGNGKKVLMATSFYDGGYDGPSAYYEGLDSAGGSVCGNYISGPKESEFNIKHYMSLLEFSGAQSIAACFSTYLATLFLQSLKKENGKATPLPFYCAPFMAEEQLLGNIDHPGGEFHAVVPWASDIDNPAQHEFLQRMKDTGKRANVFHLLGWEAGCLVKILSEDRAIALEGYCYDSPRGLTTIHPDTHHTYTQLYKARIVAGDDQKCRLVTDGSINITADEHSRILGRKIDGILSGWKNNYLCI